MKTPPVGLHGVALMAQDPEALAQFYRAALGFSGPDAKFRLVLGDQSITLHHATGQDYPQPRASNDPWFQHIAIVVNDIGTAYTQAIAHGATAISRGGPQRLPASAGGVTAWKFRDPAGHPLELLEFPRELVPDHWRSNPGLFIGIDHTAIVVADTARSEAYYGRFGFTRSGGSFNQGDTQAALDGLDAPAVKVTALSLPGRSTPHLELLEYQAPRAADQLLYDATDAVATRTLLAEPGTLARDPDLHWLLVPIAGDG